MFAFQRPWLVLIWLFTAWKILLLATALFSPGPGYDTSTQILLSHASNDGAGVGWNSDSYSSLVKLVAEKLTRWDGIYFTSLADRGYVFEQEWAFSWAYTRLMRLLGKGTFLPSQVCRRMLI
jgi:GPI mannosyltransferase 2